MKPAGGPPINEVVLSISFDEQDVLAGPRLLVALRQLISQYPEIEEQLPYDMPEELPTKSQLAKPRQPTLQFIGSSGPAKRRYWLSAKEDKSILVQVQSDYFAVNWRAGRIEQRYPGFARLKELFFATLGLFNDTVVAGGGEQLAIRQVELSYINVIRPTSDVDDHSFLSKLLDIRAPFITDLEQLNLAYTRTLTTPDGEFFGRSYTTVQTAYQVRMDLTSHASINLLADPQLNPILNLNTSVRSARHKELYLEQVSELLDQEHVEATQSFKSITTQSAQEMWGLK